MAFPLKVTEKEWGRREGRSSRTLAQATSPDTSQFKPHDPYLELRKPWRAPRGRLVARGPGSRSSGPLLRLSSAQSYSPENTSKGVLLKNHPSPCFPVIRKSPSTGRLDLSTALELELPVATINGQMMGHPALGDLEKASPL